MDKSIDVVSLISSLLDSAKYKEALSVPNDEKYLNSFKDNCGDLISNIVEKIQDETVIVKPSLQGACEELLLMIVQKSVPEEALLEFIERIELAKNDAQFSVILTPLQELLKKLTIKRGRSLEWCLNSISTYIEAIPTPDYQLEGKERLLLDSDSNYRRIIRVYSLLPPFYSPFIKELSVEEANIRTKEIISAFLISLFGKPLIYIDLDPEHSSKSEGRQCINTVMLDLCALVKNIFKFLPYIHKCLKESKKPKKPRYLDTSDEEKPPYEHREKINMTTLSGLFYIVQSGHFEVPGYAIPCVYSLHYSVNTLLYCVIHLLGFTEYGPLCKALALCKVLINSIPDKYTAEILTKSLHFELCSSLMNVAIYSNYESIRKTAVNFIGLHINKFEYRGRCMLIKYILMKANHSGMIGYAITLYKNSINEAFKDTEIPSCFTGARLKSMIGKMCHLPHGAESDLVELADQIITALNFLRYLILRDTLNVTGITDCIDMIESDYLEKLRVGLNMSKAHYEVKLKDIEEGKRLPEEETDVTINVGGNVLDKIPTENKKEIIHSALNAFHLMQGLVAHLSETINSCKKRIKANT